MQEAVKILSPDVIHKVIFFKLISKKNFFEAGIITCRRNIASL